MVPTTATEIDHLETADQHTILALDPGKTTGYCFGIYETNNLYLAPNEGELSLVELYEMLYDLIDTTHEHLHIVYEDFNYRNVARMGLDLTPMKVIGLIELFAEWHEPEVTFTKQSASIGKGFYTDDKLKYHNVYKVGKPHGRDATRHLLQWANFGVGSQWIDMPNVTLKLVDEI